MDVFMVYLFVATATPLFLWAEHKKWAIVHSPFVIALWASFIYYVAVPDMGTLGHIVLWTLFIANFLYAHVAAIYLYAAPFLREQKLKRRFTLIK
ncbi:spore morphogenesis/germination protein YwcE [Falsibacillus pallidus]|uniref:spore morphogenesis/germination protein YwcE n=1 Tax=Falsibacillus pallidus TaxID=493781 RepID=UPI003D981E80